MDLERRSHFLLAAVTLEGSRGSKRSRDVPTGEAGADGVRDAALLERNEAVNRRAREEPHVVAHWLQLVEIQEEWLRGQDAGLILDRQLDILDRALRHHAGNAELLLRRLALGERRWPVRAADKAWRAFAVSHWHMDGIWLALLRKDVFRRATFHVDRHRAMAVVAIRYLALPGSTASVPIARDVDQTLAVLGHVASIDRRAGHVQRARALFQALVEYNMFAPQGTRYDLGDLERFWATGSPRVGDSGASGWASFASSAAPPPPPPPPANAETLHGVPDEDEIQRDGLWIETSRRQKDEQATMSTWSDWAVLERERSRRVPEAVDFSALADLVVAVPEPQWGSLVLHALAVETGNEVDLPESLRAFAADSTVAPDMVFVRNLCRQTMPRCSREARTAIATAWVEAEARFSSRADARAVAKTLLERERDNVSLWRVFLESDGFRAKPCEAAMQLLAQTVSRGERLGLALAYARARAGAGEWAETASILVRAVLPADEGASAVAAVRARQVLTAARSRPDDGVVSGDGADAFLSAVQSDPSGLARCPRVVLASTLVLLDAATQGGAAALAAVRSLTTEEKDADFLAWLAVTMQDKDVSLAILGEAVRLPGALGRTMVLRAYYAVENASTALLADAALGGPADVSLAHAHKVAEHMARGDETAVRRVFAEAVLALAEEPLGVPPVRALAIFCAYIAFEQGTKDGRRRARRVHASAAERLSFAKSLLLDGVAVYRDADAYGRLVADAGEQRGVVLHADVLEVALMRLP